MFRLTGHWLPEQGEVIISLKGNCNPCRSAVDVLISVGCSCAPLLWVFLAATVLPVRSDAQSEPAWVSPTTLVTADGSATLEWSVAGDDPVALFRLTEEHAGARQISYTDQAQMRVLRDEPGSYTFTIQACTRSADGYPQCGQVSRPLVLTVVGETGDQKGKTSTSSTLQTIEVAPVTASVLTLTNPYVE